MQAQLNIQAKVQVDSYAGFWSSLSLKLCNLWCSAPQIYAVIVSLNLDLCLVPQLRVLCSA